MPNSSEQQLSATTRLYLKPPPSALPQPSPHVPVRRLHVRSTSFALIYPRLLRKSTSCFLRFASNTGRCAKKNQNGVARKNAPKFAVANETKLEWVLGFFCAPPLFPTLGTLPHSPFRYKMDFRFFLRGGSWRFFLGTTRSICLVPHPRSSSITIS